MSIDYALSLDAKISQNLKVITLPEQKHGLYPAFSHKGAKIFAKDFTVAFEKVLKKRSYRDLVDKYNREQGQNK